jgi:Thioesterase superfamily
MAQDTFQVQRLWSKIRGYNCFGCAPHNDSGLALDFIESESDVSALFNLPPRYSSYPGVAHCGIIATVLEEVMGNALVIKAKRLCFTRKLSLKYIAPVLIGVDYCARAGIEATDGNYYELEAGIYNAADELMVSAKGSYKAISPEQALKTMHVDGQTTTEFLSYLRRDDT